jgi:hypothetical protein
MPGARSHGGIAPRAGRAIPDGDATRRSVAPGRPGLTGRQIVTHQGCATPLEMRGPRQRWRPDVQHRLAFVQGIAAGVLLWTGLDGSLAARVARVVALPAGAAGDGLALLLVALWGVLVAALAWNGLAGPPARHAASRRRSPAAVRPARRTAGGSGQRGNSDEPIPTPREPDARRLRRAARASR